MVFYLTLVFCTLYPRGASLFVDNVRKPQGLGDQTLRPHCDGGLRGSLDRRRDRHRCVPPDLRREYPAAVAAARPRRASGRSVLFLDTLLSYYSRTIATPCAPPHLPPPQPPYYTATKGFVDLALSSFPSSHTHTHLSSVPSVLCLLPRMTAVLLVIAHPDDEAMFFGPTLTTLRNRPGGPNVQLLCLSTGKVRGSSTAAH